MTNLSIENQEIIADYKKVNNDIHHNFTVIEQVSKLLTTLNLESTQSDMKSESMEIRLENFNKGYALPLPFATLCRLFMWLPSDDLKFLDKSVLDENRNNLIIQIQKSVALFENAMNTFKRFVKANHLESYYRYEKGFEAYLFNNEYKAKFIDKLDYLRVRHFSTAQDKTLDNNFGGLIVRFNQQELKDEIFDFSLEPILEQFTGNDFAYKYFVYKFLDKLLEQLPNFDNEKELDALLALAKDGSKDSIIEKLKEKLQNFNVTDLSGDFEIPIESASDIASIVSEIYHLQGVGDHYTPSKIADLMSEKRAGSFIDLGSFKFSVSGYRRNEKGGLIQLLKLRVAK